MNSDHHFQKAKVLTQFYTNGPHVNVIFLVKFSTCIYLVPHLHQTLQLSARIRKLKHNFLLLRECHLIDEETCNFWSLNSQS